MTTLAVTELGLERRRQDAKWGVQDHEPLYWLAVLTEEFGEVGKALAEWRHTEYRNELIHLAAVAIQAAESYDRNR